MSIDSPELMGKDIDPLTGNFIEKERPRPSAENISKQAARMLQYKESDEEHYRHTLNQIIEVATESPYSEPDVAEIYRDKGWTMADFQQLFRELGEDPDQLEIMKKKNVQERAELEPEELVERTLSALMSTYDRTSDEDYRKFIQAIADDPNLEKKAIDYFSYGGAGYERDFDIANSRKDAILMALLAELRERLSKKA